MRNHNTLSRETLIQEIASCVPEGHKVDLQNPTVSILAEVFKVRTNFFTCFGYLTTP
jgi:tRNA acetyltransferase TAN1